MNNFWLSWYCPEDDMGKFELHSPWWISGERADGASTICAAVQAEDEGSAKEVIVSSYDEKPDMIEWRFCQRQLPDWTPFCERFPRGKWMKWDQK